jgi:hypothetical protein
MTKCPFCGAAKSKRQPYSTSIDYECGSSDYGENGWSRGVHCYEAQLEECAGLLRRCAYAFSIMRYVDKYHLFYGDEDSVEAIEADLRSLLDRLERSPNPSPPDPHRAAH